MEDDLNCQQNRRQPQYYTKWKTTSIFNKMEDKLKVEEDLIPICNLNTTSVILLKWKMTSMLGQNRRQPQRNNKMEDDLNILAKHKTTSNC